MNAKKSCAPDRCAQSQDRFGSLFDATSTHVNRWDNRNSKQNRAEASMPNNDKFALVGATCGLSNSGESLQVV